MAIPILVPNVGDKITAGWGDDVANTVNTLNPTAWTTYTPTLTASTTNPTLGTGSYQFGEYMVVGKTLVCRGSIVFGTSGAAAGSGTYAISLPVAVTDGRTGGIRIGGQVLVTAAGLYTLGYAQIQPATQNFNIRYVSAAVNGANTPVTNSAPGVFTNNDGISWYVVCRAT